MTKSLADFKNLYKLSKTLRFELRPVGETMDNIKDAGILKSDEIRSKHYPELKKILDDAHKALIERVLVTPPEIDWEALAVAIQQEDPKQGENAMAAARETLATAFKNDSQFNHLVKESTPKDYLDSLAEQPPSPEAAKILKTFKKFSCYLIGYQENRKNIYEPKKQTTSAVTRAIHVNFPKFLSAIHCFTYIRETYPEIISMAEDVSPSDSDTLESIFAPGRYPEFLPQQGIDRLNTRIGSLNAAINLYKQQHPEAQGDRKLVTLPTLFKQILSDRQTNRVLSEPFQTDQDILNALRLFHETITPAVEELNTLAKELQPSDDALLNADEFTRLSVRIGCPWDAIQQEIVRKAETYKTKKEKNTFIARKIWLLKDLLALPLPLPGRNHECPPTPEDNLKANLEAIRDTLLNALLPLLDNTLWTEARNALEQDIRQQRKLQNPDTAAVTAVKAYLDAIQELLHAFKCFRVPTEKGQNSTFFIRFIPLYEALENAIPLYNRVRNYVTAKPGEQSVKMKLMFNCSTLASGWDIDKEKDNRCTILERNGQFFLGILANGIDPITPESTPASGTPYRKMKYKLIPTPVRMLPKVCFSLKNFEILQPSEAVCTIYSKLKNENIRPDLNDTRLLIDYYKSCLKKRPEWQCFDFRFKETADYQSLKEFYEDVAKQAYLITFEDIPEEQISRMVRDGELYLFAIHNKDFLPGATGKPNLHTLYWRAVFAPENLSGSSLRLNGSAELFFRPRIIQDPVTHRCGEYLVNRTAPRTSADPGTPPDSIPDAVYHELFLHANHRQDSLSQDTIQFTETHQITVKPVKHPITKDRRYTEDKLFFHVPITLNANAEGKSTPSAFNEKVRAFLRDADDIHIIGLDRGERNLITLSCINRNGEIVEQKSFNTIGHTDYHAKLTQKSQNRDQARKNWTEIGKIKDLKDGFLSQVVHEITTMMIRRKAIVVLEDLNAAFKRGRFCIEKQVYQKFEKALIEKLNFLAAKEDILQSPDAIRNAYQLTPPFESFEKLTRQNGFIFYVPAEYTSAIDPESGFVNLFSFSGITTHQARKDFFNQFDAIRWDGTHQTVAWTFDYTRVDCSLIAKDKNANKNAENVQTCWTVYTPEKRLRYNPVTRQTETVTPIRTILEQLRLNSTAVRDSRDLKPDILNAGTDALRNIFLAFTDTLRMRNSNATIDYIASPVCSSEGHFFDSRFRHPGRILPEDADQNGAYHIALKGLLLLRRIRNTTDMKENDLLRIKRMEWLAFAQNHARER